MTLSWRKDITHLTFDCYGTLIDWESGILAAVQPVLAGRGVVPAPEAILRRYVKHEARLEAEQWRPYHEILRGVMRGLASDFHVRLAGDDLDVLADTLPDWPPFSDTIAALHKLAGHYHLVVLSNIDDALFAQTQKRLRVRFSEIITAEQMRSYKPGHAHFREAVRRLNISPLQILHVAQSLYHDHMPAHEFGFRTAWVRRPSLLGDLGLSPEVTMQPDIMVADLESLAAQLGANR